MAAVLASRLLGLIRNAVISNQLGQSFQADVYYGAFQIPDLLFYLIAGGALSSAFIPKFTELITNGHEKRACHVFNTVFCTMFVLVTIAIILGEIYAEPLVALVNPGFRDNPAKLAATVPLTRIVLPAQLCFFMGGILMGSQQSRGQFLIPALGPVIYNIGIILGGLILTHWLGMAGLCWGALVGAIIGNFWLQWRAVRLSGMQFRISFDTHHPDVVTVWKLMLPVILGVALPQVSIWINRAFATKLGDGPMAALTNANQLMKVPLGIFAQAMGVAIFPTLSALAAKGDMAGLRSTSSGGIRSLLFLTIPSSVIMLILAVPIVQLLLQHGKFTGFDTAVTAPALSIYCLGIFAWSGQSILSRSFYALQDTKTPVIVGTGITILFIPMNWIFMTWLDLGIQGLALATTVAATLHCLVMTGVLTQKLKGFELEKLALSVFKTTVASLFAGAACWVGKSVGGLLINSDHVKIHALAQLLIGFAAATITYIAVSKLMSADELKDTVKLLKRRRRTA